MRAFGFAPDNGTLGVLVGVDSEFLAAAFKVIDHGWGSADAYFETARITSSHRQQFRETMLEYQVNQNASSRQFEAIVAEALAPAEQARPNLSLPWQVSGRPPRMRVRLRQPISGLLTTCEGCPQIRDGRYVASRPPDVSP